MTYPKNKYRKGWTIFGWSDFIYQLDKGRYVYLRDRLVHPSFIISMQLKTVKGFLDKHLFSEAINQKDEYYKGEYQRPYPEGITERKMR